MKAARSRLELSSKLLTLIASLVLDVRVDLQEIDELDRRLRQFAMDQGMAWVVEELDEAIAIGVFEARELQQSTRQGRTTYEEVPQTPRGDRKRAEEFVSRRSLSAEEKVRMLLAGLRRVLSDLDLVAAASVLQLNDLESVKQVPDEIGLREPTAPPVVRGIDFAPDEGSAAAAISTESIRHADRSEGVVAALRRIEAEVGSWR